ncbi:uncharacterized protein BJX67DRAFT_309751 [Aspergillus lucknowensis]|uniref:Uncharacterized protein n=1 Tax=Aspergillus lucknowensis TaxID=176173 RepID=A0ABR4LDR9_9EURO
MFEPNLHVCRPRTVVRITPRCTSIAISTHPFPKWSPTLLHGFVNHANFLNDERIRPSLFGFPTDVVMPSSKPIWRDQAITTGPFSAERNDVHHSEFRDILLTSLPSRFPAPITAQSTQIVILSTWCSKGHFLTAHFLSGTRRLAERINALLNTAMSWPTFA